MMPAMKTTFAIEPFSFPGAAVHISPTGNTSVLQGDAIKAHRLRLSEGFLLGTFQISSPDDLHSETWEMHPAGDETLVVLTGRLALEYSDGFHLGTSPLDPGHGLVVPKGVWHRLVLREPGLLLALSPAQGTQLSRTPGQA
jgi:mannose-6-phosphate isomerase-like protein (cupin superfamily)